MAAKVTRIPSKRELDELAAEAQRQCTTVQLEPGLVRVLAHGHYQFQEVKESLRHVPPHMLPDLGKLVGVMLSVLSMPNVSKVVSEWATKLLTENQPEEPPVRRHTWSTWAHLLLGRGGEPPESDSQLRCAISDKLSEGSEWFQWATKALGLSNAYVEEQKLTAEDLRRMISERL